MEKTREKKENKQIIQALDALFEYIRVIVNLESRDELLSKCRPGRYWYELYMTIFKHRGDPRTVSAKSF